MGKKIALISSWNALCGVSVHAQLIGKEFLKEGNELLVFAPLVYEDCLSTYVWYREDEPFVIRNFSFLRYGDRYTDEKFLAYLFLDTSFLEKEFDIFIVEKPTSLPLNKFFPVFEKIKKKARTIAILHEGSLPKNPLFYKFDWDLMIVFDERYQRLFSEKFPLGKT